MFGTAAQFALGLIPLVLLAIAVAVRPEVPPRRSGRVF